MQQLLQAADNKLSMLCMPKHVSGYAFTPVNAFVVGLLVYIKLLAVAPLTPSQEKKKHQAVDVLVHLCLLVLLAYISET